MAAIPISAAPHQQFGQMAYECRGFSKETYALPPECPRSCLRWSTDLRPRDLTETKNTYHLADPSFTYLLSAFQLLTGIAWGIATQGHAGPTLRLTLMFIFVHFLLSSLVIATLAFLLIGRLLGPGGKGLPSRMRRRGLFGEEGGGRDGEAEDLEFGYCFDVSNTLKCAGQYHTFALGLAKRLTVHV
ncbi:MAG: hypothetical protein Q9204_006286 [Flavoplaca sp. TL-2023a]